ncbi:unnamed protein product [Diabrotica balteata]|uniref:Uncharacterized protein n=1 Tax=Diabrotica balteata TaxID=107213 RepID=A0A9N9T8R8_DIABA|nr:unnamed protein product [Diabrotica balteata]
MASNTLILLVIVSLFSQSLQDVHNNEIDVDEPNLYKEAASDIKREQNQVNIGGLMKNIMDNGGNDLLGTIMSEIGKEGGGDILEGLGSMLTGDKQGGKKPDSDSPNVLESLGSIASLVGALDGLKDGGKGKENQDGSPDLLKSLGAIGSLLGSKKVRKGDPKAEPDFNLNDILSLAGSFLGQSGQKDGKKGGSNFLSLLPTILQTMNAFVGPEARSREKSHAGHASLMPPFLEKLHVLFDHFIHSEMGKSTIAALGAEKSFKVFLDDKGRFSYKKFGELMENHSYRRQWIRILTDRIAEFLQYASDPSVYKSYFVTAQVFFNSYLQKEGFPKSTQFDPKRPVETITAFINYVGKRDFQVNIDSKEYVKPAVLYIKDLLKMTEKSGTLRKFSNSNELSSKLADTINLEIIEPLARVNRAIRFAKGNPKCDRYVLCLVNEESKNDAETLPGLKKLLYKGASLVGGWFLSSNTGTSFWTLYTDITNSKDCKKLYSPECDGFHVEELKVTTEYVHNEL